MAPKEDWEKYKAPVESDDDNKLKDDKSIPLTEGDIQVLKTYGAAPYAAKLKETEKDLKEIEQRIKEKSGIKESDTGLAPSHLWDIMGD